MKSILPLIVTLSFITSLALAEKPAATAEAPKADPKAHALIDKMVEAIGGEEAIKKIRTRVAKAAMSMPAQGISISMTLSQKAPNKVFVVQEVAGLMKVEQGFDGEKGWAKDTIQGLREVKGVELEQLKRESNINREIRLKEDYPTMKLLPEEKDGEKTLLVIEAVSKDDRKETWYFDAESSLLTKMKQKMSMGPMGELDVTLIIDDYREVDGVKLPFKTEIRNAAFKAELVVEEVKHNVDLEDSLFATPEEE